VQNQDSQVEILPSINQALEVEEAENDVEHMHIIDHLAALAGGINDELAESMVTNRLGLLWERYSREEQSVVEEVRRATGGVFFTEIKNHFLSEVEKIEALVIPAGWSFTLAGGESPCPPNVMQRRIAWLVREQGRVGNWSGTGAGKPLSAVLASRVCDARLTLVVTNYATLTGWQRQILTAYPGSLVYRRVEPGMVIDNNRFTYIVLNYEQFQGRSRHTLLGRLLKLPLDFVVLDEVHLMKQRDSHSSQRRQVLETLLHSAQSRDHHPLRVLGMSATPVINNLVEGKRLLETIVGRPFPELRKNATLNNALAVHRALVQHGYRFLPRYEQELRRQMIMTVRNDLLDAIQQAGEKILTMEQALLSAKLEAARTFFRKGTIVYTYYVEDIIQPIYSFLTDELGFSVGCYTGDDKSGLDGFLTGQLDVLVGSQPLGTGLDGLQSVCDRLILLSLPWTGAEYEHLLGRIRRQGSAFGSVDIVVPQVILEHAGARWSWDERLWSLIHYKRTLTDCAVDGRIPASVRISPHILLRESRKALERWMKHVGSNATSPQVEQPRANA